MKPTSDDAECEELAREDREPAGPLREERLDDVPAVVTADREHAEHEREDAAEDREDPDHVAGDALRQEIGRELVRVREHVQEEDGESREDAEQDPRARALALDDELGRDAARHASSSPWVSSRKTSSSEARSATSSLTAMPAPTSARLIAGAAAGSAAMRSRPSTTETRSTSSQPGGDPLGVRQRLRADAQPRPPEQLVDGPLPHQLSRADDADAVADLLDLGHQVAREEDGAAALAEAPDELAHLGHAGRVEAVRRLVEDQQVRVLDQRGRDAEPLLHPLRVRAEAVACPLAEADLVERGRDPLLGDARMAGEHAQVVPCGQERIERGGLDHRPDPRQPLRRAGRGAEHDRAPARRPDEPEKHAQRRRLAGPVRAEEAVDLAPAHAERKPVDGKDLVAVALGEIARLDHELVLCHRTRVPTTHDAACQPRAALRARFRMTPRRSGVIGGVWQGRRERSYP